MNTQKWPSIAVLVGVALLAGISIADDDHVEARRLMRAGTILPLEAIIESIQKQQPGRILEVELEREHGRYIYEIDLLDGAGVVWEMKVDAITGKPLKTEQEH